MCQDSTHRILLILYILKVQKLHSLQRETLPHLLYLLLLRICWWYLRYSYDRLIKVHLTYKEWLSTYLMYNLIRFDLYIHLWNYHHNQHTDVFIIAPIFLVLFHSLLFVYPTLCSQSTTDMFLPIWSCVIWRIIIWIYLKFVNYHINFLLEKYSFVSFMCQKYLLSQRLFSSFLILSFYKILNFKLNKFINDFLCGLCCSCLL